jgi:hypothetical protein
MPLPAHQIADTLNSQRAAFRAFLSARVGSEAEADDHYRSRGARRERDCAPDGEKRSNV